MDPDYGFNILIVGHTTQSKLIEPNIEYYRIYGYLDRQTDRRSQNLGPLFQQCVAVGHMIFFLTISRVYLLDKRYTCIERSLICPQNANNINPMKAPNNGCPTG